jgi:hypothetical protein
VTYNPAAPFPSAVPKRSAPAPHPRHPISPLALHSFPPSGSVSSDRSGPSTDPHRHSHNQFTFTPAHPLEDETLAANIRRYIRDINNSMVNNSIASGASNNSNMMNMAVGASGSIGSIKF